jgi:transcriptional regulator of aromatic amino acid metabolism
VLITGESGTGKELVARAIHDHSARNGRPIIKFNCAAIPEGLFESEFFGYVKGALTGALKDRPGRFELADAGSLFLDEVGEVPLAMQAKLLRVLQERELERIGDTRTRKVNVRVIAATNRDIAEEVDERRFRLDLFYRLRVFPIEIPPLVPQSRPMLLSSPGRVRPMASRISTAVLALSFGWSCFLRAANGRACETHVDCDKVMHELVNGKSAQEVARDLGISPSTVYDCENAKTATVALTRWCALPA